MLPRIRLQRCLPTFKREMHELSRYVFVQDYQYDLLKKMRKQSVCIPQVDPMNGFPSSFARNLLHPFSNHIVSQYAREYYKKATPYFGEFPIQFFGSEIYPVDPASSPSETPQDTHSIVIYPDQVRIKNIEKEHIPHIIRLCNEDTKTLEEQLKYDSRMEKLTDISLYFFCDISSLDRTVTLFQWFDLCFRRSNHHKVHYIFSSGNMKNDQSSTIIIHNGDYRVILSQHLTLKDVDRIVQHMINWKNK
jgi:hypothetical protein